MTLLAALPLVGLLRQDLWYAAPLLIVVSLVYSATRYERMRDIVQGAMRFGTFAVGCMGLIFALLFFLSWGL